MGDEHTSDKRPFYRKLEQEPTVVCRDQNQLASMTLHAPNDNDPAHFKETDVFIETFFDEIIHQYTSEVLTSLPERYEHKRIPLRVRCAELKLQLNNCTLKRDTALTQNLGEGYQVRQTRTKLRNIAQSENHQTEKSLEASGGINAGKFFNFALSGLFKQTDAKKKPKRHRRSVFGNHKHQRPHGD